jgi:hypothetical protein
MKIIGRTHNQWGFGFSCLILNWRLTVNPFVKPAFWTVASAIAAFSLATPAQAAQFFITYTGKLGTAPNVIGPFGAPGSRLDGKRFVASFTYDDAVRGNGFGFCGNNCVTKFGFNPPGTTNGVLLTGSLNVDGIVVPFNGNASVVTQENGRQGRDGVSHKIEQSRLLTGGHEIAFELGVGVFSSVHDFVHSLTLTDPLDYTVQAGDIAVGSFSYQDFDLQAQQFSQRFLGQLITERVTIAPIVPVAGAVPEPASWALMIAGFGLIGGALRRSRSLSPTPA